MCFKPSSKVYISSVSNHISGQESIFSPGTLGEVSGPFNGHYFKLNN